MQKNVLETLIGAIVLAVAGGFLVFAYQGSQVHVGEGYIISGKFTDVSGVGLGSDVRIGGIKVGVVSDLKLDPNSYEAVVYMQVSKNTRLPKDSSAAVASSGLLGEKFIQISPGGEDELLKNGGKIEFTQSSVNLEELIGKFMFSGGGVDSGDKNGKKPTGQE